MGSRRILSLALLAILPQFAAAQAVRLREPLAGGSLYHVSIREEVSGELRLPAEGDKPASSVEIKGRGAQEYDERIMALNAPQKSLRIYRRCEIERTVGDKPQEATLRPEARRLVILRKGHREVPFSPDGPLTWNEIDMVSKDVFTPGLMGMLPDREVRPGDRWPATAEAVQELTDLERIDAGGLECRFEEIAPLNGRRLARVRFTGSIRGLNQDGPSKQQLDGIYYFDLDTPHLSYLSLEGSHALLDKDGTEMGRVRGRFVLTRQCPARCEELGDDAIRGLATEPTPENTLLLYDNPDAGVRLLHPRRWHLGVVQGRQVLFDEPRGSGLMITVEPIAQVPAGPAYLEEVRGQLGKQKAKIGQVDPPRRAAGLPEGSEQFGMDVELAGRRERLEYRILRQGPVGATVAARLNPADLQALQEDIERMVRSVKLSQPAPLPKPVPPPPGKAGS